MFIFTLIKLLSKGRAGKRRNPEIKEGCLWCWIALERNVTWQYFSWLSGVTAACWQTGPCLEPALMEWQSGGVWSSGLNCIDMARVLGNTNYTSGRTDRLQFFFRRMEHLKLIDQYNKSTCKSSIMLSTKIRYAWRCNISNVRCIFHTTYCRTLTAVPTF